MGLSVLHGHRQLEYKWACDFCLGYRTGSWSYPSKSTPHIRATNTTTPKHAAVNKTETPNAPQKPNLPNSHGNMKNIGNVGITCQNV